MTEQILMKDGLGPTAINRIAIAVRKTWPQFDAKGFTSLASSKIGSLELKQRVQYLIKVLHEFLPDDFEESALILTNISVHWDFGDPNDPVRSFAAWPIIDYAAEYGLEHPETSLALLKQLTHLMSAEFAIRPFILRYPELCFAEFDTWVTDDSDHVRRLVSEGSRPRLPWGARLQPFCENPTMLLPLLERLNNDPSDYVRRSVANSINDISKDNPDIAVNLCKSWSKSASSETLWIIRHAMRSLIKQGRTDVFPLLGFTDNPKLTIADLELESAKIQLGQALLFATIIQSKAKQSQRLAIDFAIHHRKANGTTSAKVFKWKELTLDADKSLRINKKHAIRKINTRAYYSGKHYLELIVNGVPHSKVEFHLDCLD
jgi:3-methyladenine DNA glycosylase AlkC